MVDIHVREGDQRPYVFNTVALAVAGTADIPDGEMVQTLGYHTAGDGGGNEYIMNETGRPTADGGFAIHGSGADDWLDALDKSEVSLRKFGLIADDATDGKAQLELATAAATTLGVPMNVDGKFFIDILALPSGIAVDGPLTIKGNGKSVSSLRCNNLDVDLFVGGAGGAISAEKTAFSGMLSVIQISGAGLVFGGVSFVRCGLSDVGGGFVTHPVSAQSWASARFETNDCVNCMQGTSPSQRGAISVRTDSCPSVTIKGNHIDDTGTATRDNYVTGIHVSFARAVNAADTATVTHNIIRGVFADSLLDCVGIQVLGGNCRISKNEVRNIVNSNPASVDFEGIYTKCKRSVIANNTLVDAGGREGSIIGKGQPYGVDIDGGYDNIISNNTVINTDATRRTIGIRPFPDGTIVSDNLVIGFTIGIDSGSDCTLLSITDNEVRDSLGPVGELHTGIFVSRPDNVTIEGNRVYGIGNAATGDSAYGIYAAYGSGDVSEDFDVHNNKVRNLRGTGSKRAFFIAINAAATVGRISVTYNKERGSDFAYFVTNSGQASRVFYGHNEIADRTQPNRFVDPGGTAIELNNEWNLPA